LLQAVQLVDSQAKLKDIAINSSFKENIDLVIDSGQMEQVFVNILQNAIQATPEGGRINILLLREMNEAAVHITDTGGGISPEYLNRIFDLYFTTKTNGTGMGLSISHKIVSEHDGRIDVESHKGHGATFSIYLPIRGEFS
jgi:two-component system sporulation sensor kinase C